MTIKNLILAAIMGVLVALTSGNSFSMHHEKSEGKKSKREFARSKLESKAKAQLIQIYEENEKLHSAFFNYNAGLVEKYSSSLRDLLLKIENKKIKKVFKRSLKQLEKIKSSNEKEKNYHLYSLVSKKLVEVLMEYDLGGTYNAYSCPMVRKVWVQNSTKMDKVHNPYASYMPHCGEKDTSF